MHTQPLSCFRYKYTLNVNEWGMVNCIRVSETSVRRWHLWGGGIWHLTTGCRSLNCPLWRRPVGFLSPVCDPGLSLSLSLSSEVWPNSKPPNPLFLRLWALKSGQTPNYKPSFSPSLSSEVWPNSKLQVRCQLCKYMTFLSGRQTLGVQSCYWSLGHFTRPQMLIS